MINHSRREDAGEAEFWLLFCRASGLRLQKGPMHALDMFPKKTVTTGHYLWLDELADDIDGSASV
jgi:hypothetical protein